MNYKNDKRIVLTLDAGGTNFIFSAVQSGNEITELINLSAKGNNIEVILKNIISGFKQVHTKINQKAVAISFSFPGPSDYKNGIIGNLENLPAFRGGVALKAMLENKFQIPVFINNDGDLFTFGEAIAGILPEINSLLEKNGNIKRYNNLFGVTFGTGYGGGIVTNGNLFLGDNSAGGEINRMRNKLYPETSVEDSVSIRGIQRVFARETGTDINNCPSPKEIFEIGTGIKKGDKNAAIKSFEELAIVAGDSIANSLTLIDGLVVIGGGLSGAYPLFLQKLVDEMNNNLHTFEENSLPRMEIKAFNLENKNELKKFLENTSREISVPFSNKTVNYDPVKRIGVGISKLGTSKAASIGAYNFALDQLDK
ncbi:MAG: ROK family protein [Bacteroidales bacterium]|nr:ROK family protein [Bacteroidales bacterium]